MSAEWLCSLPDRSFWVVFSSGMPWRTCIIIGPDGQNVDVVAHEWLHSEIQHRVGFWRFLREIPIWFDEGAALTVDFREPFLPENIDLSEADILAVQSLDGARRFFSGNTRQNYQAKIQDMQDLSLHYPCRQYVAAFDRGQVDILMDGLGTRWNPAF